METRTAVPGRRPARPRLAPRPPAVIPAVKPKPGPSEKRSARPYLAMPTFWAAWKTFPSVRMAGAMMISVS